MNERLPIPGYEGLYEIDRQGVVYGLPRLDGKGRRIRERVMRKSMSAQGYYRICLSKDGMVSAVTLHRLLAITFLPTVEGKDCINHRDGNKTNNDISNLEWVTRRENMQHAHRNGLAQGMELKAGERSIASKLSNADVLRIREMISRGMKDREISEIFGVVPGTIGHIRAGNTWAA